MFPMTRISRPSILSHRRRDASESAQIETLKEKLKHRKGQLEECRQDILDLQDEVSAMKEKLGIERSNVERLEKINQELRSNRRDHAEHMDRLKHRFEMELVSKDQFASERDREIEVLKRENADKAKLMEVRTLELRTAQAFLSTSDSMSEEEVVQTVKDLNSDIFQAAVTFAEDMMTGEKGAPRRSAFDYVADRHGTSFANMVQEVQRHPDGHELLQSAIQAVIAGDVARIIRSWGLPLENVAVVEVYDNICSFEDQAVAGKWRALTRKHIRMKFPGQLDHYLSKLVTHVHYVFKCAGIHSTKEEGFALILSRINKKLASIVELALQLHKVLGEDITSSDMKVFAAKTGSWFDASTTDCHDSDERGPSTKKPILATLELGLTSRVTDWRRDQPKTRTVGQRVLLKSQVIFEGYFDSGETVSG